MIVVGAFARRTCKKGAQVMKGASRTGSVTLRGKLCDTQAPGVHQSVRGFATAELFLCHREKFCFYP